MMHNNEGTSVSEWKFTIASAFKFKLFRQPAGQKLVAPGGYFYSGCCPDNNGQGNSQLGRN